jgi:hypothetical protein
LSVEPAALKQEGGKKVGGQVGDQGIPHKHKLCAVIPDLSVELAALKLAPRFSSNSIGASIGPEKKSGKSVP